MGITDDVVTRLTQEVESLKWEVERLKGGSRGSAGSADDAVSRRRLLGKAAAVAAGGIGLALASAPPASATSGDNLVIGSTTNDAGTDATQLESTTSNSVFEAFNSGSGGGGGLSGVSSSGTAVSGAADSGAGVVGQSNSSDGVQGYVLGSSATTNGVHGICISTSGKGVFGECTNGSNGQAGVWGKNAGTSLAFGVVGECTDTSNTGAAVYGLNSGTGPSIWGTKGDFTKGDGVFGQGSTGRGVYGVSTKGRGGEFKGKKAQIRLTPSTASTHPTNGQAGDLFVDSTNRLWFCQGGSTWVQLAP